MKCRIILILLSSFFLLRFDIHANSDDPSASVRDDSSPVAFLQNKGQWAADILYQGTSTSTHVFFLKDGLSFAESGKEIDNPDGTEDHPYIVWNMKFVKPNHSLEVTGDNASESKVSYLRSSNPADWIIHPPEFKSLRYNSVYENIDIEFFGSGNDLKCDYIIHPGGDINTIQAYYEGIENLSLDASGELKIKTIWNTQIQKAPIAWQVKNGIREYVQIEYHVINDSTFGFKAVGKVDENYTLIIDPLFQMVWSSYTQATGGSNNINYCFSNAMDNDGNVYLTGMVDATFPTTPGAYSGPGNVSPEIFVAKFSNDGTTLLYSTYLPANSSEHGADIAVDDLGRAYVTGVIDLNFTGITNYPSTPNAYQPVHSAGSDAFLTVLNPTGTGLVYSSFLGGSGGETGYGIVLGPPGIAYITGETSIGNFPVKASSVFPTGDNDLFVAKFDINQSGNNSLVYSVRIGAGSFSNVHGRGIAVNSAGNVFITGTIFSSFGTPTFPITPGAYNSVFNTGQDGVMTFVTKLSANTPVTLSYSTFLVPGTGNSIAVNPVTDETVIAGSTYTFAFPVTTGALQPTHAGNNGTDAFAVKLNAAGNALVYSTFLGGNFYDVGTGVALNSAGEAYVVGIAQDLFPTSPGAYQPNNAGTYDFFAVHINSTGTGYGCGGSTYIGGSDADYSGSFYDYSSPHVSIRDHSGINDTICISSTSHSQDFPTTPGVYGPIKVNGIADQPVFFKLTCVTTGVAPTANFNTSIVTACNSAVINLTDGSTNNPSSWQWYFPGGTPASSTQQHPQNISYTSSGTYTIKLVACNPFGCDSLETIVQVTIPQNVPVSLGNDTIICNGNNIVLSATPGQANYSWQLNGINTGTNNPNFTVSQPGVYSVTVTDTIGCTGTDTIIVAVSTPVVNVGPDVTLCNSDSLLVTSTSGFSLYQWQLNGNPIGSGANSIYVSQAGVYNVNVVDSIGCTATDSLSVSINNPVVNIGPDILLCNDDSSLVAAAPGFVTYSWTLNGSVINANNNSLYVSQQGVYILSVEDSLGCSTADTLNVAVNTLSLVLSNDTSFCAGNSLDINAGQGFATYQWQLNGNVISTSPILTVNQSGNYILTVTSQNGCTATDNVVVTVNPLPVVQTLNDVTICYGQSITLTTSGATSYSWSPSTFLSSTNVASPVSTPMANITYVVIGTDDNNCSSTDEVNIVVVDVPEAVFDYSLDYDCQGILLTTDNNSTNATNYLWNFDDGSTSTEANPQHYYTLLQNQSIQLIAFNASCNDTIVVSNISFAIPGIDNIPNVFTPNGDGKNDCFSVPGTEKYKDCFSMTVFNRWGNLVYESSDSGSCWKGTGEGNAEVPDGVYLYVVTIASETFKGTIHLMR